MTLLNDIDPIKTKAQAEEWPHSEVIRTLFVAHKYIKEHFDELKSCDVIDVGYILKEKSEPKKPQ